MSNIFIDKGRLLVDFDEDTRNIINTIRDVDGILITEDERMYVHYIVSGLKAIGVWTKIKALYGFVGSTAATHKWNWKDMRDLDAAYRIVWSGVTQHTSLGVQSIGSNGYGDTKLIPASTFIDNNISMGLYNNSDSAPPSGTSLGVNGTNFSYEISLQSNRQNFTSPTISGGGNAGTVFQNHKKGVSLLNTTSSVVYGDMFGVKSNGYYGPTNNTLGTSSLYLLAMNYTLATPSYSSVRIAFAYISDNLTTAQLLQLPHIITTAQSILGRK